MKWLRLLGALLSAFFSWERQTQGQIQEQDQEKVKAKMEEIDNEAQIDKANIDEMSPSQLDDAIDKL
jgi:hypothetical protein